MVEKYTPSFENKDIKKEKIRLLEKLNIGSSQKANIILVALGLKLATELDLYRYNDDEETVKEALTKAGLEAENKDIGEKENKNLVATISIACDKETLGELLKLDPNKNHEEYGRIMGYPETAIQAHSNKELLLSKEDYPDMRDNIFPMKLSKDNWREEWEFLKEWNEAIKKYAPETYQEARGKD